MIEQSKKCQKNCDTLLDVSVSSLRRGHANLLCIVPILADDPRGVPLYWHVNPFKQKNFPLKLFMGALFNKILIFTIISLIYIISLFFS